MEREYASYSKKRRSKLNRNLLIDILLAAAIVGTTLYITREYLKENPRRNHPEMYEKKPERRENNQSAPDLSERLVLGNYHEGIFHS